MKEKILKILLYVAIYSCIIISSAILFFNGSFGYFLYIIALGAEKGPYIFSTIALMGALLAIIPILFHKNKNRFYYYVLLTTNAIIIFYPFVIKGVAEKIVPKLISII